MTYKIFCIFSLIISFCFGRIFEKDSFQSGRIDLGNGGDQIFYILFRSRNKNPKAPLIMYMAGGPGTSGEYNILLENGPYIATENKTIIYNKFAWNNNFNLLYIDQPVGVGFSKGKDASTICKTKLCVNENMYIFLQKLIEQYPEYERRPFYISGVSYAGHYVPGLSAYLIKKNNTKINFRGALIGGPWVDFDLETAKDTKYLYDNEKFSILQHVYYSISVLLCRVYSRFFFSNSYLFCALTNHRKDKRANLTTYMNIKNTKGYGHQRNVTDRFWKDNQTQKELGVYPHNFELVNHTVGDIYDAYDTMYPYQPDVAYILDHGFPVTFVYGKLDYTCHNYGGLNAAEHMKWTGAEKFRNAEWKNLTINGKVRGENKTAGNFEFILVNNAGHLIPNDQPDAALYLIEDFIKRHP